MDSLKISSYFLREKNSLTSFVIKLQKFNWTINFLQLCLKLTFILMVGFFCETRGKVTGKSIDPYIIFIEWISRSKTFSVGQILNLILVFG